MALIPLRVLLDHAAEHNYGVAAFNVNNMEQIQSIMEAAHKTDGPVIVQASRGARSYSQDAYLRHLMLAAAELYPHIPIVMHQDHGNSPSTCYSAIKQGFTCLNTPGTIDADYRGEIKVILINLSGETQQINNGDRIAQMVFQRVEMVELIEVSSIDATERNEGGFGHTGKQ